jgi:hypothetical protein
MATYKNYLLNRDGNGILGAQACLYNDQGQRLDVDITEENGLYTFLNVITGHYQVRFFGRNLDEGDWIEIDVVDDVGDFGGGFCGATGFCGPDGITGPCGPVGDCGPIGICGIIGSCGSTGSNTWAYTLEQTSENNVYLYSTFGFTYDNTGADYDASIPAGGPVDAAMHMMFDPENNVHHLAHQVPSGVFDYSVDDGTTSSLSGIGYTIVPFGWDHIDVSLVSDMGSGDWEFYDWTKTSYSTLNKNLDLIIRPGGSKGTQGNYGLPGGNQLCYNGELEANDIGIGNLADTPAFWSAHLISGMAWESDTWAVIDPDSKFGSSFAHALMPVSVDNKYHLGILARYEAIGGTVEVTIHEFDYSKAEIGSGIVVLDQSLTNTWARYSSSFGADSDNPFDSNTTFISIEIKTTVGNIYVDDITLTRRIEGIDMLLGTPPNDIYLHGETSTIDVGTGITISGVSTGNIYVGTGITIDGASTGTITGGTWKTASGAGQRVEVTAANNQLNFYDTNNSNIVKIGENIYQGNPGLQVRDGTLFVSNQSYTNEAHTGIAVSTTLDNLLGDIYGIVALATAQDTAYGAYGAYFQAFSEDTHTGQIVGMYAHAQNVSGSPSAVWAGYFNGGNVLITNYLRAGGATDGTTDAYGIKFGSSEDTNIYRGGAHQLKTDDSLVVGLALTVNGNSAKTTLNLTSVGGNVGITFGTDTTLYRSASYTLMTDDTFIVGSKLLIPGDITAAITANPTSNWAPTGYATASRIRITATGNRGLTGIVAGSDGDMVLLHNTSAYTISLWHNSTSTVANRFYCPNDVTYTLLKNASVWIVYDGTSSRWRIVSK